MWGLIPSFERLDFGLASAWAWNSVAAMRSRWLLTCLSAGRTLHGEQLWRAEGAVRAKIRPCASCFGGSLKGNSTKDKP